LDLPGLERAEGCTSATARQALGDRFECATLWPRHAARRVAPSSEPSVFPWQHQPVALPLVVEPSGDASAGALVRFLSERRSEMLDRLREHGAILMRGFAVDDALAFERVARAIDDELKNEYLGTSPRDGLTDYAFSASEQPPFYPIPQHCEMSFTRHPPRRILFCCLLPSPEGGETPPSSRVGASAIGCAS
jgi:Taurine catabolism dioxygenase TauD, TfdA family